MATRTQTKPAARSSSSSHRETTSVRLDKKVVRQAGLAGAVIDLSPPAYIERAIRLAAKADLQQAQTVAREELGDIEQYV